MAYLIAPPLEATFALDAALKAADVEMAVWFAPPSETNFSGGLPRRRAERLSSPPARPSATAVLEVAAAPREV